jgi:hypothetical protein
MCTCTVSMHGGIERFGVLYCGLLRLFHYFMTSREKWFTQNCLTGPKPFNCLIFEHEVYGSFYFTLFEHDPTSLQIGIVLVVAKMNLLQFLMFYPFLCISELLGKPFSLLMHSPLTHLLNKLCVNFPFWSCHVYRRLNFSNVFSIERKITRQHILVKY